LKQKRTNLAHIFGTIFDPVTRSWAKESDIYPAPKLVSNWHIKPVGQLYRIKKGDSKNGTNIPILNLFSVTFYPLFEEKVGIVLLSGSEVGLESELSRCFEVP